MKQIIVRTLVLAFAAIAVMACTVTGSYRYGIVVESEDDNTTYTIKYVNEITKHKAEYETVSHTGRRFYFSDYIHTFTMGNTGILDAVTFTIQRNAGDGTCVMYIVDETAFSDREFPLETVDGNEITDDEMNWVKSHSIMSCRLDSTQSESSVVVTLE